MTDVKSIVSDWLISHHYDGLFNESGECGCSVDDLMPCDGVDSCVPAYRYSIGDNYYFSPNPESQND